MMDYSSMLYKK